MMQRFTGFTKILPLLSILAIFPIAAAYGAPPAPEGPAGTLLKHEETSRLESITVTAQKKEKNVQDVPASVDVFSHIQIEDARMENILDLTRFSPNVHMKQNYTEHVIVIRGIPSFRASTHSPAGLYVDDVSYPLHYMQNATLFDVERAEILKGPQGTLYGRNTESGVISIITRQPGNETRSRVFGEYAGYDTIRSGANFSGPLVADTLFMGAAFQYKISDGFIDNTYTGNDKAADLEQLNGRAALRWTPAHAWDLSFTADVMEADNHIGGYRLITGPDATSPHEVRKDEDESYKEDGHSQVLRIKYRGDRFDVLSVSGLLNQSLDRLADSDLTADSSKRQRSDFKIEERQFSQEFRILSNRNGPFEWLGGFYGFTEQSDFDYRHEKVFAGITVKNPIADIDTQGYAFFGQATYSPVSTLHLTAGLRFDHQDLDGDLTDAILGKSCSDELSYDEFLPKFSVAYDISDTLMAYGSVSRGYLAGGFNWLMNPVSETFNYDSEYTWNYELGMKSEWMNGRLMANLSVFYTQIDDKQVAELDADTSLSRISNAAEACSQGLEFEVKAVLIHGVEIFAGMGVTESKFDEFTATEWNEAKTALVERDYQDNYLPYAPKYTYNAGIQYRSPTGIFCRADFLGAGKYYGDAANTSSQSDYQTVNLRLGYETESVDIYLWVENLFDEEYLTYVSPFNSSSDVGLDGAPRIAGITLAYRF